MVAPALPSHAAAAAAGRTFYLSATGSDAADGRATTTAWRTLSRANRETLGPGDRLLLQGGARFTGPLVISASGTAEQPLVVGSYGTGRAIVAGNGDSGIFVWNAGGIVIQDLTVIGDAGAYTRVGGISIYLDKARTTRVPYLRIARVEVSGFKNGIDIGTMVSGAGFQDVLIESVLAHDNRDTGVLVYGPPFGPAGGAYAHADVRVRSVNAYRNLGDPQNLTANTGSGIVLGSVDGGVIADSTAYENGSQCRAPEGPYGIWAYDSRRITIERNIAYRNRTGASIDGGGFDLDQNVGSSVLQHNLSYSNDGPGIMVYTGRANDLNTGNTVRFNISVDDARGAGDYGAMTIAGRISDAAIYHNTIVSTRHPVLQLATGPRRTVIANNVFVALGAVPVVKANGLTTGETRLTGNTYYGRVSGPLLLWGTGAYTSVAVWRTATGQEADGAGFDGDPRLQDVTAVPTVTVPAQRSAVTQYTLRSDSPLAAARTTSTFTLPSGIADYFGATLGVTRSAWAGASQPGPLAVAAPA
ncbi:right-handed parallel beta-helix repeat-containing protein [Cryptosporangium aurantiacum]|nr:right-handed parallel beta-helix repeat-containing protein [Cryptosporangium aurantiacum]